MTDNAITIKPMTAPEASAWKDDVRYQAKTLTALLFEGYQRQAWKMLGFDSWEACIKSLADEFGITERHMRRLHAGNKVENALTPGSVGNIPERWLRELNRLGIENEDQIKAAYQKAIDTAPDSGMTAAHVKSVVDDMLPKTKPPNPFRARLEQAAAKTPEDETADAAANGKRADIEATIEAIKAELDTLPPEPSSKEVFRRNQLLSQLRNAQGALTTAPAAAASIARQQAEAKPEQAESEESAHEKASDPAALTMPDFDTIATPDSGELRTVLVEQHAAGTVYRMETKGETDTMGTDADRHHALFLANLAVTAKGGFHARDVMQRHDDLQKVARSAAFVLRVFGAARLDSMPVLVRESLHGELAALRVLLDGQIERLKPAEPGEAQTE